MLHGVQIPLYFAASVITFVSYQMIPRSLEKIHSDGHDDLFSGIVTSNIFTFFVRLCGNDHLVMATVMCSTALNLVPHHPFLGWILVGSAWIVAIISAMSASVIWKSSK